MSRSLSRAHLRNTNFHKSSVRLNFGKKLSSQSRNLSGYWTLARFPSSPELLVQRTFDASSAFVQDVSVNHRCFDTRMAQQLLNGSDVIVGFDQMRGETMPERVGRGLLRDPRLPNGLRDRPRDGGFVGMVASLLTTSRANGEFTRRKNILPLPFAGRVGKFSIERLR